jgi:hypothetical protein
MVPLVDEPPEPEPAPAPAPLDLVTVFKSADPGLIALAKSLLESAQIPFVTRGEGIQDWVGLGRFPGGANIAVGPVDLRVSSEDADEAKMLLEDLEEGDEPLPDQGSVEG